MEEFYGFFRSLVLFGMVVGVVAVVVGGFFLVWPGWRRSRGLKVSGLALGLGVFAATVGLVGALMSDGVFIEPVGGVSLTSVEGGLDRSVSRSLDFAGPVGDPYFRAAPALVDVEVVAGSGNEGAVGQVESLVDGALGDGDDFDFDRHLVAFGDVSLVATDGDLIGLAGAQWDRVIVRTVALVLEVANVGYSVDLIGAAAQDFGGWVVSSERRASGRGFVSVRVPAVDLDDFMADLRLKAAAVVSEVSNSSDVTEDYADTVARLKGLTAAESSLLEVLGQAESVPDVLAVQRELSALHEDIEALKGRIRLIRETSRYSLVEVELRPGVVLMTVDGGPDRTVAEGRPAEFQASFVPPRDDGEFNFVWDFGDGSAPVSGGRTVRGPGGVGTLTATVVHTYSSMVGAPFVVEVEVVGEGPNELYEGADKLVVDVIIVPDLQVRIVERGPLAAGEVGEFVGVFNRRFGVRDLEYKWDFGDGSRPLVGSVPQGDSRVTVSHSYRNDVSLNYVIIFEVEGQSAAGPVQGSALGGVRLEPPSGSVFENFSVLDTFSGALRVVLYITREALRVSIWLLVLSPMLLVVGFGVYKLRPFLRKHFYDESVEGEEGEEE